MSHPAPPFVPRSILCAVDLGPHSPAVLRWTRLAAWAFRARAEVLHVDDFEDPRALAARGVRAVAEEEAARRESLRSSLRTVALRSLGPEIRQEQTVVAGDPLAEILKRTAERRPDLLVIGAGGRTGKGRALLGSVAENLVQEAPCPVLVVKDLDPDKASLKVVLCPVGLGAVEDLDAASLGASVAVARAFGARLEAVHVVEDPAADVDKVRRRLSKVVIAAAKGQVEVAESMRRGEAAREIAAAVREHGADLVVIAARRRPFLEAMVIGTTAERVIRHAPASVLILGDGYRP